MTTRFFVYGAMTEGHVHWSKISAMIEEFQPAKIRATAWRLPVGFPALTQGGETEVEGLMVTLKPSELLINLLDEFHGFSRMNPEQSLYHREEVMVGEEKAWVYFLNPKKLPSTAEPIPDGNWRRSLESEPALTSKLTERQKTYLLKLGAATGREIVPINDLSLYRELMNLELIVDKGRRLALSKFGQEVFRHLE